MQLINHLNLKQKSWVEISDNVHGTYNTNCQIRFEATNLKSSSCIYNDACLLVRVSRIIVKEGSDLAA